MKKIFYLFALFFCVQIVLAQQDSSYLPLQVGNYWKFIHVFPYYTNEIIEWKVLSDTIFGKRGKYFLLQGEFLEYVRKADNGDIITYFPQCDSEFVRYPFSYPFYLYHYGYSHEFPRYRSEDCGANPEWGLAIFGGIDFLLMTTLSCDWYFARGKGPFRFFNGAETFILQEYILNPPQLKVESLNKISDNILLYQNYPNPFNPETKISYSIPETGFVKLMIYDLLGREVKTLFSGSQTMGNYTATFNASSLSSGLYFVELSFNSQDNKIKTKLYNKILLTK